MDQLLSTQKSQLNRELFKLESLFNLEFEISIFEDQFKLVWLKFSSLVFDLK